MKRLADVVCLPASRIAPQERHMAADLLVDVLRESPPDFRLRCAKRIAELPEAPTSVLRWLAVDDPDIAAPVIENSEALRDADLAEIVRGGRIEHRIMVAARREVTPLLSEVIVESEEPAVIMRLLENRNAELSEAAINTIVRVSRDSLELARPLSRRRELKPSQGLTLFWWSDPTTRKELLLRFGVERQLLQDAITDVYATAADEGWSDPVSRKALQFIERRQRNRGALGRSPYGSLEEAVTAAATTGLSRRLVEEMAYLAGLRPATGAKIITDLGGEPIAVLCKAAGLRRVSLDALWSSLRRPLSGPEGKDPIYEHVIDVFESLAIDKAQTVLRYWNWSLTSAVSPSVVASRRAGAEFNADGASAALRASRLVWGG